MCLIARGISSISNEVNEKVKCERRFIHMSLRTCDSEFYTSDLYLPFTPYCFPSSIKDNRPSHQPTIFVVTPLLQFVLGEA